MKFFVHNFILLCGIFFVSLYPFSPVFSYRQGLSPLAWDSVMGLGWDCEEKCGKTIGRKARS
jgi:hypothetical protein